MRGFGEFQRAQMKRTDPRIAELFRHVRDAIDILERVALESVPVMAPSEPPKSKSPTVDPPITIDQTKIAHSIKDVSQKIGVSRAHIYKAIANKQLRAVKCGGRTQILSEDLQAWVASWPALR
jgi:excisionase family DNA binding protein